MRCIYAYLKVFSILNDYWCNTKNPDLGSILSGMNPDPLYDTPYLSADPGAYADWVSAWNQRVGRGRDGTNAQILDVAKTLLSYYTDEVGYQIGDAVSCLESGLNDSDSKYAAVG